MDILDGLQSHRFRWTSVPSVLARAESQHISVSSYSYRNLVLYSLPLTFVVPWVQRKSWQSLCHAALQTDDAQARTMRYRSAFS
jgi:hypothetical protein